MASLDPGAIVSQLTDWFLKQSLVNKVVLPVLLVGAIMAILFVSKLASKPREAILFSGLDESDSAQIVELLKERKVKYVVHPGGSKISISPPEMVHELRLEMKAEGIPSGGQVGYEIFEEQSLGSTVFSEMVKYLRASQGELEKTIMAIDIVQSARVHITKPEKGIFNDENNKPKASVMLRLRSGRGLEKSQIRGIRNLVAGGVEGLEAENVNIIDSKGKLISPSADEGENTLEIEATRLTYQREIEKGYSRRIEQMLVPIIGEGKVIARVTADLDFSMSEREEESFDPGGNVIRSERTIQDGSGASQRGGVPGVVSNLSDNSNLLAAPGSGRNSSQHTEEVRNYEVSRAVSKTSSPRGTLVKLSAAVLVDGKYVPMEGAAEGSSPEYMPLEPEMMSQIESLVRNAIGYDPVRGDSVTVENIKFEKPLNDYGVLLDKVETMELASWVMSYVMPSLFIFLFFIMMIRPLVKYLIAPTEAEVDLERLLPTGIEELEAELESERKRAAIPENEPAVDIEQLEDMMSENSRIVKENPQQTALLIRYWLNDGRL